MFIAIPNELVAQIDTNENVKKAIIKLFGLFYDETHKWYFRYEGDDEDLYDTPFLDSFRPVITEGIKSSIYNSDINYYVEILPDEDSIEKVGQRAILKDEIEVTRYPKLGNHRVTISSHQNKVEYLSISMIETFLKQPLKILVENIESDSLFVEKCLKIFADIDPDHPNIMFENGGGCGTVGKVLEKLGGKHRLICIVDSDQTSPGVKEEHTIKTHQRLIETCKEYGYVIHFLNKREMENYLPEDAIAQFLVEIKNNPQYQIHPYFSLFSPNHKDFFDMKKGMTSEKMKDPIWDDIRANLNEIAAASQGRIRGFDEIWQAFHFVTSREALESRDSNGELEELVIKITSLV